MKDTFRLKHLLVILLSLAALAAVAWFYTNASDPVAGLPVPEHQDLVTSTPDTQEACLKAGGVWNECASACPPEAQACIQMCVRKCEFPQLEPDFGKFKIYFSNARMGSNEDCGKVFPVLRPTNGDVDTFGELLKGPTKEELAQGYFTSIPTGVKVLRNGVRGPGVTWFVDFSEEMRNVAGSCKVTAIRAQIEQSLRESVPDLTQVVITIEGGEALQP